MMPRSVVEVPDGLPVPCQTWWRDHLSEIQSAYAPERNGHLPDWHRMLERVPEPSPPHPPVLQDSVVWDGSTDPMDRDLWMCLHPWRKGPYRFGDLYIDTEWRSDWKWDRLANEIAPLDGRICLDVGCGNGYHLWRMKGAGASHAIGIDPYLLYVFQFHAIHKRLKDPTVRVLPLGAEHLDRYLEVDTVFSMGVLYHATDPHLHLETIRRTVRPGGQLVLETLIVPDERAPVLSINGRYARMRNIRMLPTEQTLIEWVQESGWRNARIKDVTVTSIHEQRSTEWMTFHSLEQFLDPEDKRKTVEGFPAPCRCLLLAEAPI